MLVRDSENAEDLEHGFNWMSYPGKRCNSFLSSRIPGPIPGHLILGKEDIAVNLSKNDENLTLWGQRSNFCILDILCTLIFWENA